MTNVSDYIEDKLSWMPVTAKEQAEIVRLLKSDPQLTQTVRALAGNKSLQKLFMQTRETITPTLLQIFGGRLQSYDAQLVRDQIVNTGFAGGPHGGTSYRLKSKGLLYADYFDVCYELYQARQLYRFDSLISTACPSGIVSNSLIIHNGKTDEMFTGSGATSLATHELPDIPLGDQWKLYRNDQAAMNEYKGPSYSMRFTMPGRSLLKAQVNQVLCHQIDTVFPDTYSGSIPTRRDVIAAAAKKYKLTSAIVASLIMTEQLDQSQNEDAAEFQGAIHPIAQKNSSIGLGQVVISTATRHELFSGLLSGVTLKKLGHNATAYLLASDEFNIFAVAKFIRYVADLGATKDINLLPNTKAMFPNIDMKAYAQHASMWPEDNIAALASEYTSEQWEDGLVMMWSNLTRITHRAVTNSGVPFK